MIEAIIEALELTFNVFIRSIIGIVVLIAVVLIPDIFFPELNIVSSIKTYVKYFIAFVLGVMLIFFVFAFVKVYQTK